MEPEVVMTMDADTAHRFWLGKVNVTVALARGQMKAKGPVAKILKLVPLTKPVFPRYRAQLEAGPAATCSRRLDGGTAADLGPPARCGASRTSTSTPRTTRVIAGAGPARVSAGFEFQKEGARRVFVVTDEVIRGTGLVDRVEAGVAGRRARGGRRVRPGAAGLVDRRGRACAAAAKEAGADSFLAVGGGSVMDTAKVADAVFTHGGSAREQEGFFLMPREDDGMGRPLDMAPLACIPTTAGTGSEVSMAAVIKDPERRSRSRSPTSRCSRAWRSSTPRPPARCPPRVAAATGMDADDPRDRGLRLDRLEPAPGRALAAGAADDPRQPRARGRADAARTRTRAGTC